MGKPQKRLEQVAQAFMDELAAQFPGVEQRVTYEDRGGSVVWVWVKVPHQLMGSYWQIHDVAAQIYDRLIEDTGVNIIAAVTAQEPELVPASTMSRRSS